MDADQYISYDAKHIHQISMKIFVTEQFSTCFKDALLIFLIVLVLTSNIHI